MSEPLYVCHCGEVYGEISHHPECPAFRQYLGLFDRIALLEGAINNYYSAVAERNSRAYPEPDDCIRMGRAIDETQAALFALLQEDKPHE